MRSPPPGPRARLAAEVRQDRSGADCDALSRADPTRRADRPRASAAWGRTSRRPGASDAAHADVAAFQGGARTWFGRGREAAGHDDRRRHRRDLPRETRRPGQEAGSSVLRNDGSGLLRGRRRPEQPAPEPEGERPGASSPARPWPSPRPSAWPRSRWPDPSRWPPSRSPGPAPPRRRPSPWRRPQSPDPSPCRPSPSRRPSPCRSSPSPSPRRPSRGPAPSPDPPARRPPGSRRRPSPRPSSRRHRPSARPSRRHRSSPTQPSPQRQSSSSRPWRRRRPTSPRPSRRPRSSSSWPCRALPRRGPGRERGPRSRTALRVRA